jgi:HAD superfamily hydrolase (TIGR01490 family)
MPARVGAFFDVDKTILSENSGALYLRALWERGEVDWRTVVANLASYLQYKVNLLNIERFTENTVQQFKGQSEKALLAEAEQWFADYCMPSIYPEAAELVHKHQGHGHVVALVSGATKYIVDPLASHLGVEHTMHTHMEVKDGEFTGRVIQPVCFGEGKIYWLQQLIERAGIDLAKSYFYTDSITDLPLLDLVGHPVVVNPDPLLYREARRRRWPVRLFDSPSELSAG